MRTGRRWGLSLGLQSIDIFDPGLVLKRMKRVTYENSDLLGLEIFRGKPGHRGSAKGKMTNRQREDYKILCWKRTH